MQFYTILLICILVSIEIIIFVPSFYELQKVFHLSAFMVELTLGVNLVAHCISSLITGNLGDRYGRKPIILIGLIIFILGSIFCLFANGYIQLLIGRFLQGIGIASPGVLAYASLADMYKIEQQQRKLGIVNGVSTLAKASASIIGGFVIAHFSWRGNFAILTILGIISLISVSLFIQNSKPHYEIPISLKQYLPVVKSRKTMYYIFTICLFILPYWVFVGIAPILYVDNLGVSIKKFGFHQSAMTIIFSLVSLSSGYFLKYFGQKKCFFAGIAFIICFIFLSILLILFKISDPIIITCVLLLLSIGVVMPLNILRPLALISVENAKGRIEALLSGFRLILTSVTLQIISFFYQGTFSYVGITMIIILLLAFLACSKLFKEDKIFR